MALGASVTAKSAAIAVGVTAQKAGLAQEA
jgi:hypothetical protein